jgi:hypothetical protein
VLEPFLHLWVGSEIATMRRAPVGRILIVIGVWLDRPGQCERAFIDAVAGQPAVAARVGLFELPFYAAGALWFGIKHFGLTGAAVAVGGIRALFDYGVLLWLSAIRTRPIVLDMLAHLAFLLGTPVACRRSVS